MNKKPLSQTERNTETVENAHKTLNELNNSSSIFQGHTAENHNASSSSDVTPFLRRIIIGLRIFALLAIIGWIFFTLG